MAQVWMEGRPQGMDGACELHLSQTKGLSLPLGHWVIQLTYFEVALVEDVHLPKHGLAK